MTRQRSVQDLWPNLVQRKLMVAKPEPAFILAAAAGCREESGETEKGANNFLFPF